MNYQIVEEVEIEKAGLQEEDDYIVYNPLLESVVVVNHTAGETLLKLKQGQIIDEIFGELALEYKADINEIKNNIQDFLEAMHKKGFIVKM